jgi:hypothetical protein
MFHHPDFSKDALNGQKRSINGLEGEWLGGEMSSGDVQSLAYEGRRGEGILEFPELLG